MTADPPANADAAATLAAHVPWLVGWLRVRAGADAEDLAQEALAIALRNRGRIARPDRVGSYLFGIARRLLRRHRRRPRLAPLADEPHAPPEHAASPLTEALRTLPDALAQVVHAYYAERRTYEEVAALLSVPRATVQSRLRRALDHLRHRLDRELP